MPSTSQCGGPKLPFKNAWPHMATTGQWCVPNLKIQTQTCTQGFLKLQWWWLCTWWSPIATWFNDWIKAQRWNPRCSSASGGSHENGDNIPTMNWMAAPAVSLRWRKPRGIGAILPLVTSQVVHVYKGYISGIMCPHPRTEHSYNEKPVLKQCLILKLCAKKPWC